MQFNIASYILTMKKYAINRNISNEDFTRELFSPFVTAGNVKDKNGELLELNKSRVSRLLAQKDDVPSAMRNALSMFDIVERTAEGFADFLTDNIDAHRHDDLILVAIASFDEWNNAQSTKEKIKKAIIELLKIYDKTGQGYPMY